MRTLGFDATNNIFAEDAWYFRNALVRANYNDLKNGIHETTEYLELFLRNLLLDEKHELHNRAMHISGVFEAKVDIRNRMLSYTGTLSEKTIRHAIDLYTVCREKECFGRSVVEEVTGIKSSGASKLISVLLDSNVIEPVSGKGKGKYKFHWRNNNGYNAITLKKATREDIETIWKMQVEAFTDLLDKYQDFDMSPATESLEKIIAKFEQPWTTYYFIVNENIVVGAVRVVNKNDGSRKRISPIWIMAEFRNKGYAGQAIAELERIYGSDHWCLDTILQEKGNLHLYEKMGYVQTGKVEHINERMDIVFYEKN